MGRSALLLINRDKPEAEQAASLVRGLIERHGTLVGEAEAEVGDGQPASKDPPDLLVTLGGDGTLLLQARRFIDMPGGPGGAPLLGVNLGRLGFLAEYDLVSLQRHAERLFGGGEIETRGVLVIDLAVQRAGAIVHQDVAINELVITAGPPFRMVDLALSIDGHEGPGIGGDGLIVSTPTGSTAHNVSAGGPILEPHVEAMVITPIAAHSLSFRPIVVDGAAEIAIDAIRVNDEDSAGTTLVADGQRQVRLQAGDRVIARRRAEPVRFVTNPDSNYWHTLIDKMRWAEPPRWRPQGG